MALSERRWRRREPTVREVSIGEETPYAPYDYYIYAVEGDDVDIETTEFVRGIVNITRHPTFLRQDGTHLSGRVPLINENANDDSDIFEIDLEANQ